MSVPRNDKRAVLLMLAASLLWPAIEHAGVSLMPRHHPMQVVFLRYAAHLVVLLTLVLPVWGVSSLRTRRPGLQMLRGILMFGMPVCFVLGAHYGTVRWTWAMFWAMPVLAVLAAMLLLHERPHRGGMMFAIAGAAGGIAIMGGSPGAAGTVFGLGMAGTVAGYMVLTRMLRDESLPASLLYTALGAILPTALLMWRVWTPILPSELVTILIIGVISVCILGAFDLSLEAGPVWVAVPVLVLVPIWESLLAVSLDHSLPGSRRLAGIAVIAAGAAMLLVLRIVGARAPAKEQV